MDAQPYHQSIAEEDDGGWEVAQNSGNGRNKYEQMQPAAATTPHFATSNHFEIFSSGPQQGY